MLNRRHFLSRASVFTVAGAIPAVGNSLTDDPTPRASGRTVINAIAGYANLAKGFIFTIDPTNSDANGYPIRTPNPSWGANPSMPTGYFGDYVWKFRGRGSMQLSACAIIRAGGAHVFGLTKDSGETGGNTTILDKENPRVVLTFGAFIQNISQSPVSNGAGGHRIRISFRLGYANNMSLVVKVQALTGHGQAAALGIWNCIRIDSSTFDLATNVATGLPSIWDAKDPYSGPGGEAVSQASNLAVYLYGRGRFSDFTDVVFCKFANEPLVDAGKIVDPDLIEQLRYLKPAWLRFMDLSGVQASYESDFSRRVSTANLYYPAAGGRYVPDYWVGTIARAAGDAYTCANPIASRSGEYVDNEVVQGVLDFPNTGINPTLNVDGRGAKYIYDFAIHPLKVRFWGAVPALGATLIFRFRASWLNDGSPYDVPYIVGSRTRYSDTTFTGLKANLTELFAANATLAGKLNVWNSGDMTFHPITPQAGELSITYLSGPSGTYCRIGRLDPYNLAAEQNKLRVLLGGTLADSDDLSVTFSRSDLPGGAYTLRYTVKTAVDTSLQALCASLSTKINSDTTLQAVGISSYPTSLSPNTFDIQQKDTWAGGGLSLSWGSNGLETATFGRGGAKGTFIYSYLLDGWIWHPGGMIQTVPFEYMVELCNAVGANCWFNWPINTGAQYITDVVNYFRLNLRADLKFGTEVGNEMWNFSESPWGRALAKGFCLGFSPASSPNYSFTAARIKQYGDLTIAAWTSSRPRSQLYLFNQSATWDLGNTNVSQFKGTNLDANANKIYGTYGGVGGGPAASYNVSPNRPIDICDGIGIAPYWGSPWLAGDPSHITGTLSENAPMLQAARDHSIGNIGAAYTSLYEQFYGTVTRTSGNAGGLTFSYYKSKVYPLLESIAVSFDSGRSKKMSIIHYEGGPHFGVGNINNGTNDATTDIPGLASRIKALGWNVSAYTVSGANDATEMASQIVGMVYNFKFSSQFKALYKQGYTDVVAAHSTREAMGAQYGYAQSQWGLFPQGYGGIHYSSFDAIHEFNGGN